MASTRILAALLGSVLLLAGAGGFAQNQSADNSWQIGPVIKGKNYSVGMPPVMSESARNAYFDFPYPTASAGHVHYVTVRRGSLAGKREIVMRYRIDAAPGTRFVPQEYLDKTAFLSLYFQRDGDRWNAKGRYEHYRWYAPAASMRTVTPGVHEVRVPLSAEWISVLGRTQSDNPAAFRQALADSGRLGFVFGSDAGRGHGVFATGPARFTLLDFDVR